MTQITFPACYKVYLFGGGQLMFELAKWCARTGYLYEVWTDPRHAREIIDGHRSLELAMIDAGVKYRISADIQQDFEAQDLSGCVGIGFGEAWQFGESIINRFENRLLDFMGIPLPRYRGGAHYSHMILRGDRHMGAHLQVVTTNTIQGEYDDGLVIDSVKWMVDKEAKTPKDYFDDANPLQLRFLINFLEEVQEGHVYEASKPDDDESEFLPRLATDYHGWIDWSWPAAQVIQFIRAFDDPYSGARTRLVVGRNPCDWEYRLKAANPTLMESYHAFHAGLVVRVNPHGLVVALNGGCMHIGRVLVGDTSALGHIRPGMRFITDPTKLESARYYRAEYGAL